MARRPLLTIASNLPIPFDYWSHRAHAFLGFYVLCHFIYRYGLFFFSNKNNADHDMGFDGPTSRREDETEIMNHWIMFAQWFLPHFILQFTGFVFPLPIKRHPDGNRIWPQYRWEALVFSFRCISLLGLAWTRKINKLTLEDGSWSIMPAAFCVGLTMVSADWISLWYKSHVGMKGNRTIRDLTAPKWVLYFMSSAQFHATVHCLLTSNRLSVQIAALTVVQLSAFGMTLRRKGFISQKKGVLLYAMVLVLGMIVIFDDLRRRSLFNVAIFFGNVAAVLRMYWGMDKYVLWCGVAIVLNYLLRQGILNDEAFAILSPMMHISSWLLLLGSCYLKHG
mmetsp:Transcript_14774/g.28172  ORF Transcript_14774/g.28172 Transcript_14774/m.28172 type:complete len:336 (+) Transcript_14774:77-1084(+)